MYVIFLLFVITLQFFANKYFKTMGRGGEQKVQVKNFAYYKKRN